MDCHKGSKPHKFKGPHVEIEKKIYGQKQAGHVWNLFLVDMLMSIGFILSLIDDCVFFQHDDIIFMVYLGEGIFLGSNDSQFRDVI